jgi:hypothetical protein
MKNVIFALLISFASLALLPAKAEDGCGPLSCCCYIFSAGRGSYSCHTETTCSDLAGSCGHKGKCSAPKRNSNRSSFEGRPAHATRL